MFLQTSIEELMTPHPLTLSDDERTGAARKAFLENGFTSMPVVDATGRLSGLVSATDLLRGSAHERRDERPLSEVMTRRVLTAALNGSVTQAASSMASNQVHHLVVVDGRGRPVGVLSAADIARAVASSDLDNEVSRIMSAELVMVDADASAAEARQALEEAGVTAAAVRDPAALEGNVGELVGVISQMGLLDAGDGRRVEDIMEPLLCVGVREPLSDVARAFVEGDVRRALVVDTEGEVVGIVTLSDLVSYVAGLAELEA